MEKLLYIDACIRDEDSRTKKIANEVIKELKKKYDITTLVINELPLEIINKERLKTRFNGYISKEVITWANLIKNANRIVISAPFWDMSIPAALKVFIELCSIMDITFKSNDITCYGNCICEKVLYITTRGMKIETRSKLDQGTSYLEALSFLWRLGEVVVLSANNLDYLSSDEIKQLIDKTIQEGKNLCKDF